MTAQAWLMLALIICVIYTVAYLAVDLKRHWRMVWEEPGKPAWQGIFSFIIYFFASFGVSDYSIATVCYPRFGWVKEELLPGTLLLQTAIPTFVMSLTYTAGVPVEISTLLPCIVCQTLGSYIGSRFSLKLNARVLRKVMGGGLLLAGIFMLISRLGILQLGGTAIGLSGLPLVGFVLGFFIMGILKPLGVGLYPLTMSLTYLAGLNPLVAYPLMTSASVVSAVPAVRQFVKAGAYARKVTLVCCICGMLAALVAVYLVQALDIGILQWVVLIVVVLGSIDMLFRPTVTRPTKNQTS